jgi:hypothetical protein
MVPKKGLEPPHPCGYMDLNHARLPIPPLRQVTTMRGGRGRLEGRCYAIYSYSGGIACQTGVKEVHRARSGELRAASGPSRLLDSKATSSAAQILQRSRNGNPEDDWIEGCCIEESEAR